MGAANTDANGFMVGSQVLNIPCGNLAGDGPNRTHNPIPTDAPTQSTLQPVPPLAVLFNQQPASLTSGGIRIAGTSITLKNPA